jgi:hypothetical protein
MASIATRIVFSRLYLLLLEYCKVQKSFVYQAKSMSLSVVLAFAMFIVLEYAPFGQGGSCGTLANVWCGLTISQSMRAIIFLLK